MTIEEAGAAIRTKRVSSVELTRAALARAEERNPVLNAFITLTGDQALAQARVLDEELAGGLYRGPLHGIPIAHKDLISTAGVRTTNGSKLWESHVPSKNAAIVDRLHNAGAVSIGKLGLHELAYGITSTNPWFGAVRNPWNPEHIPGGSSGGSGAAVADHIVFLATGTDTGGSIRIPASYCGVAGFKPTYGLVDRAGIRPLGLTLDHAGPLTRTVADARISMQALCTLPALTPPSHLRLGVPKNFYFDDLDPDVENAVRGAIAAAESAGMKIVNVTVPDIEGLNAVARVILMAESSAVYSRHLSQPESLGPDVLALLEQGRAITAVEYIDAQRLRKIYGREFRRLFENIDLLLTPTTPIVAPRIGQTTLELGGKPFDTRLAATRFMRGINVVGLPALSLPCGLSSAGLPIGAQLIGRAFEDSLVLDAGVMLERLLPKAALPESA